ncbi:MAG: UDP-2,3-diacylglucosamine diphosphatase [Pseudomonadota bacterium]
MSTLFISDLHLSAQQPNLTRLFLYFLQHQARHAEALYILGDLFETWIGDDNETPFNKQIATALAELTASGVATYFMAGNRDFLMGQRFIEKTGCKLLADPKLITLYGIPTLLMHGDSLCTLDKRYVIFRRLTRTRFLQSLFLKLPLWLRQKIACYLRGNDNDHENTLSDETKFDVVMSTLCSDLKRYPAQLIIHGHTHKPCIQLFQVNKSLLKRIVLSDWNTKQGNVLIISPNKRCELIYFS